MKTSTNTEWGKLSIIFIVLAALLIILSFFAPIIFTQFTSKWDFSETGQIGDTIGGIMNPFIAIGGVVMTFLAFYMQVRANKLQREQFLKTLNKDKVDKKIDCFYKLTLLKFDLEKIMKDIPDRIGGLNAFIEAERRNPFTLNPLRRKSTLDYNLAKEFDRLDIFKSFEYFLSDNNEWVQNFQSLFPLLDYMPKALDLVYTIIDSHLKEIFGIKDEARKMLIMLEEESVKLLNDNNTKGINLESNKLIETLIRSYRAEIDKAPETDMLAVLNIISSFSDNVSLFFNKDPKRYYYDGLNDLSLLASKIVIKLNSIPPKSHQVIEETEKFINTLGLEQPDAVYGKLQNILNLVSQGLNGYSIEGLQEEYNKLPN